MGLDGAEATPPSAAMLADCSAALGKAARQCQIRYTCIKCTSIAVHLSFSVWSLRPLLTIPRTDQLSLHLVLAA